MAAPLRERNPTCLHADTFPRKTGNGQIELSGSMLFQHMHLESHSQSGEMVIQNVSVRMVRSSRDESVLKRLMKNIE